MENAAAVRPFCAVAIPCRFLPLLAAKSRFRNMAKKLASVGEVTHNPYLLRVTVGEHQLTVFADGRTIVAGTDDVGIARSLVAKHVDS